jgi:putative zinc finger protein
VSPFDANLPAGEAARTAADEHARFAFDDGPYVLGALDPAAAAAFEQHLAGCPLCQQSVAEVADLPGSLGMVAAADLDEIEPPPDTLLPRLMRGIRTERRRRTRRVAAIGFAAACLLAVLVVGGSWQWTDSHRPQALAMRSVGPNAADVHATVILTGSGKQTRIQLDCGYHGVADKNYPTGAPSYRMIVFNRLGQMRDLGTWVPQPGEDVRITRNSPWSRQNISKIEVSDSGGNPLLQLNLS